MQFGRPPEEPEIAATHEHWPGGTVIGQAYANGRAGDESGRLVVVAEPA
jgi:hypothetical protein